MGLMATHEIIRMANALGIDIDYSTLRFWQKRGLVPKPQRGAVRQGRGTRGYYDTSLIERLGFIREIQRTYALGLDAIRDELQAIDRLNAASESADLAKPFRDRLDHLRALRAAENRKAVLALVARTAGIAIDEIASVTICKKDGQVVQIAGE
jgi:DNA-binding transcriptional MerR regulator